MNVSEQVARARMDLSWRFFTNKMGWILLDLRFSLLSLIEYLRWIWLAWTYDMNRWDIMNNWGLAWIMES
jgi:hypothetical protein